MKVVRSRKIALLVDTSVTYSSLVIRGVARYAREQTAWQLLLQPGGFRECSSVPRHWDVDGVIARVTHSTQATALRRLGVPVVNVSRSMVPGFRFPQVLIDDCEIAGLAAAHLIERGFRSFAYFCATDQPNYEDRMGPAFADAVGRQGVACTSFTASRRRILRRTASVAELERWLQTLPRPVGILAWDAEHGHNLREACASAGLRVPDDAAIICGEDDELLCEVSTPALSAVECGSERVGYEAARLLARCLAKEPVDNTSRLILPLGVLTRESTDILAIEDHDLARVLTFLRRHAYGPLHIPDVLKQVPLSRRALEQRFRRMLGRSPAAELRRLRLGKAKELLAGTNWPMPRIAAASGFSQTEIMNRVFRRELRQTPTQYRRAARAGGGAEPGPRADA